MKRISGKIFSLFAMLALVPAIFFSMFFLSKETNASAETKASISSIDDVSDKNSYFTMKATPVSRNGGTIIGSTQTVTTENGDRKFYCFNWRDISSITFNFTSNLSGSKSIFTNYQFLVTAIQTENLQTSMGQASPKQLISGTITSNSPSFPNVYYYMDSNTNTSDSQYKFSGNDFGIYKFDFNYTFVEDSSSDSQAHTLSIGELYIAILPDDVDTISVGRVSLKYTVTSSKELMNVYQITFSNPEIFKYVNPKYIKWSVFGKDKKNAEYVLTKAIRDNGYLSYKYIWEALPTEMQEGSSFILDTNNIEGTWNVHCTIYNSDWTEKTSLSTGKLSTIKHKEKSYIWLILGIVFGVIIIATTIVLLIYKNKNKKKT